MCTGLTFFLELPANFGCILSASNAEDVVIVVNSTPGTRKVKFPLHMSPGTTLTCHSELNASTWNGSQSNLEPDVS